MLTLSAFLFCSRVTATSYVTVRVTRPKDEAEHTPSAKRDPRRARAFAGSLPHQAGVTSDTWGSRYRLCHMPLTFFITFNAHNHFMSRVLSPTFARRGSSDPSQPRLSASVGLGLPATCGPSSLGSGPARCPSHSRAGPLQSPLGGGLPASTPLSCGDLPSGRSTDSLGKSSLAESPQHSGDRVARHGWACRVP